MPITTCIIPAAGRGSRWAPISGYLPKEMLPLIDKPVIEWCIDEAKASGFTKIIIVINKQKELIKDYLLENKKYQRKISFQFVFQEHPKGISHAIWLCKKYTQNKGFAVALPDLPVISKKPALKQLSDLSLQKKAHIVSFDNFSPENLHLYGECKTNKTNGLLSIEHFCSKVSNQKPHHKKSRIRMSGRFIFTSDIFPIIKSLLDSKPQKEITDVDALHAALNVGQEIVGVKIIGRTYDTGTPKGYVRANTAFFKKYVIK